MIDFDEELSDNHSPSINQMNHSLDTPKEALDTSLNQQAKQQNREPLSDSNKLSQIKT